MVKRGRSPELAAADVTAQLNTPEAQRAFDLFIQDGTWVLENRARLLQEHPGGWIAVRDKCVHGSSDSQVRLLKEMTSRGVDSAEMFVLNLRPSRRHNVVGPRHFVL